MRRTIPSSLKPASLVTAILILLSFFAFFPHAFAGPKSSGRILEPKEYDRLDGHGATAKKVDVIEWGENLEIHVYPKRSLKSLGLKLDRTEKKKSTLVIEYGFQGISYTLIRRATLGIILNEGFKAYSDPSAKDYDKIMISNSPLVDGVKPYRLAPEPTQLYPDYHPALGGEDVEAAGNDEEPGQPAFAATPTSESALKNPPLQAKMPLSSKPTTAPEKPSAPVIDSNGGIRSFAF